MPSERKKKLAVWKFASCDGCQLSLLDCEDELIALSQAIQIAYFPEGFREVIKGPYDVSLVEDSITTSHDAERIHRVRRTSKIVVAIGAFFVGAVAVPSGRNRRFISSMRSSNSSKRSDIHSTCRLTSRCSTSAKCSDVSRLRLTSDCTTSALPPTHC